MNKTIDLHVHSTASDGTFTPTELVAEAKRCGLSAFALTDHDTVDGISEALAAGEASGLEVIPGVELSTEYNETEIHVVGLFIDPANTELQAELAKFRDNRDNRNLKMIEKLPIPIRIPPWHRIRIPWWHVHTLQDIWWIPDR